MNLHCYWHLKSLIQSQEVETGAAATLLQQSHSLLTKGKRTSRPDHCASPLPGKKARDCFGGCTDPNQGFHGKMDEVRIWRTARTQSEILSTMRWITGLEHNPDLVAWWKFNEPERKMMQSKSGHVHQKEGSPVR
eukprot:1161929-Pelagomonas_calceolata.AAC.10